MSGKKQNKVNPKRLKTKSQPVEIDMLPETGTTVPAVPKEKGVQVYRMCEHHVEIKYRVGGFCEKCYGDETKDRIMALDATLDAKVLMQLDDLIDKILASDDLAMVERFIGRIMKRFSRPETKHIEARLQAVHLHGPVDFGKPK